MTRQRRFARVMKRTAQRVSGRMTRRVVTLLRQRKVDVRSLEMFENRDARIEVSLVDALIERAAAVLGADGLALAIAGTVDEDTYDAAGRVMLAEATLEGALTAAFEHQRLWGDGERFTLRSEDGALSIGFTHPGESPLARAILSELAFIEVVAAAKMLTREPMPVMSISFNHAALGELTKVFTMPVRYRAKRNELVLKDAAIDVPRELVQRMLKSDARRAVAALPSSSSFASLAGAQLDDFPSLAVLAKRLHVSPRTLQRRLAAEGTSHFELIDALRASTAGSLESKGLNEKEIAHAVGFSDERALSRARRRWK